LSYTVLKLRRFLRHSVVSIRWLLDIHCTCYQCCHAWQLFIACHCHCHCVLSVI